MTVNVAKRKKDKKIQVDSNFTRQKHQYPKDAPIYALCKKYDVKFKVAKQIMKYGALAVLGRDFLVQWRRTHNKTGHKVLGVIRKTVACADA